MGLVEPPLTVMLFAPPSIFVLLPRMSGSSLVNVIVLMAIVFENVIVVPGLALAKVMASRSVGLPLPFTVSALLVTTHDVPAHCASAGPANASHTCHRRDQASNGARRNVRNRLPWNPKVLHRRVPQVGAFASRATLVARDAELHARHRAQRACAPHVKPPCLTRSPPNAAYPGRSNEPNVI